MSIQKKLLEDLKRGAPAGDSAATAVKDPAARKAARTAERRKLILYSALLEPKFDDKKLF